ncbi:MAG: prenyltransferase [Candidatus Sumerlaeota bacterium]|nr:prenyltransferase [Candidatus Sumerlaeota bacterium]
MKMKTLAQELASAAAPLASPAPHHSGMNRRAILKAMAAAGIGAAAPKILFSQGATQSDWKSEVIAYLETLARPDGGYAWGDQQDSHLTPTFAVIGCYQILKQTPPRKKELAEFVRSHHPARLKKLEQERRVFEFQQVQSLVWLGEEAPAELREKIRAWKQPLAYLKQYEQHGYPIFQSEASVFACRALLGLSLDDLTPGFTGYLDSRRRANGSFNNTPASDGDDGHIMNTWWGMQALRALGRAGEKKEETIAWLRACQLPNGGFTYQPKPEFGGVDDVAFTRAAARALHLLGAAPTNRDACLEYLRSLANADGGFGDQPGWASNATATYCALDALEAMGVMGGMGGMGGMGIQGEQGAQKAFSIIKKTAPPPSAPLPSNLKVFTIQIEAHGKGSPAEAVDLAGALRIHLWGAKNAKPEWIKRAQAIADERKVPVKFFVADEEYGTWVGVPGLGVYSHTSDVIAPAGGNFGAPLSNAGVVSWPEFRERRLAPLQKAGGRLIWQFGENEELVRMYLDDSLERGGYTAISTFHFGNPDFTNSEPFLQRYRGRIPFIALQDAHGEEPWWFSDMTSGFRTVFLAAEPTWDGWLDALRQNRVAAIRHDAASANKTWMHSGSDSVVDFIRQHERDWRWWENPEIQRPMVSIVAVKPGDEFEAARPSQGVTIRVRCAWENTAQGLPKNPIAELKKLTIDGAEVSPKLVAKKQPRGAAFQDYYHELNLPNPVPGKHTATAVVHLISANSESSRTIEFVI